MKFTKMTVTGQLDAAGADRFARRYPLVVTALTP